MPTNARNQLRLIVKDLFVYPIKGCRELSLMTTMMSPNGFKHDRQWMLVNNQGEPLTEKTEPALKKLTFYLHGSQVWMQAPGMPDEPLSEDSLDWFEKMLGRDCLVLPIAEKFSAEHQPVSLIADVSLAALNDLLEKPFEPLRFRPNIIVSTDAEPNSENTWRTASTARCEFNCAGSCLRPHIYIRDLSWKETAGSAARRLSNEDGNLLFGVFLRPKRGGVLSLADELTVSF